MRSWVFRHRLRLRAIYTPRPEIRPESDRGARAPRILQDGLLPGECGWRGRNYVIRPHSPAA